MNKQSILNTANYILLSIILFTVIIFSGTLKNSFTNWDDDLYVFGNLLIRDFSLENLEKIFLEPMGDSKIYRPITYLTYMIDFQLWELDPWGYHFSSLVYHLINVILVFYIFKFLTNNLIISSLVALFFALNPLKVEAVAWASARVDVVYAMFYLGGLLAYITYLKNNLKIGYFILSAALFMLSLLSKPSAVTFPVACLLLDYFMERKWTGKLIIEKIPLFLLSIAMGVITLLAQRPDTVPFGIQAYSLLDRFLIICYTPIFYLFKSLFPFALSNYYDFPKSGGPLHYLAPILLIALGFLVYRFRKNKGVLFSALFFMVHIGMVVNLIPTGNKFFAADRYVYLAQIGVFFLLIYLYSKATETSKSIFAGTFVILLLLYASISFKRAEVWRDGYTLWSDAVQKNNQCSFCYFGLGNVMINSGQQAQALPHIERSIMLNDKMAESYHSRGVIRFATKDYKGAILDFDKCLSINPTYQYAYTSRGSAYASTKDYSRALQDYQRAIALNPNDIEAYLNRSMVRGSLNDYSGAKADLDIYISANSNNAIAFYNRGFALAKLGNTAACCTDWKRAYDLGYSELKFKLETLCGYKL
jgi:protein O-mannosyl-transferase